MNPTLKKVLKHVVGRDLWLRREAKVATTFHGSVYGGWAVRAGSVNSGSVIYSFGVGEDASFDLGLIEATGCTVHGFDPTPKSLKWVEAQICEERFVMHPWALGAEDGTLTLWLPNNPDHVSASLVFSDHRSHQSFDAECRSLQSIMNQLRHQRVDVLKMDIEGAEYGVIASLCETGIIYQVDQLLVEFHHRMEGFTRDQTRAAILQLREAGFRIEWVSDSGHELLFGRKVG